MSTFCTLFYLSSQKNMEREREKMEEKEQEVVVEEEF